MMATANNRFHGDKIKLRCSSLRFILPVKRAVIHVQNKQPPLQSALLLHY
jgi:hypothetical protein